MTMARTLAASVFGAIVMVSGGAFAAGGGAHAPDRDWTFEGIFATFDLSEVQRGLQVYLEVCANCHGLQYVAYRDLGMIGYDEDQIKAIAAEYEVEDGPDSDGEMFMRAARPADRFVSPYPNSKYAAAMNGGAVPPDLSLIYKARANGANYLHALLSGYEEEPEDGFELMDGLSFNPYFPGHQIAMPQPLYGEDVEYADGTEATIEQESHDVTAFLAWAAEPYLERRKSMGLTAVLFVLVLTGLFYACKRKIWADLH